MKRKLNLLFQPRSPGFQVVSAGHRLTLTLFGPQSNGLLTFDLFPLEVWLPPPPPTPPSGSIIGFLAGPIQRSACSEMSRLVAAPGVFTSSSFSSV